MLKASTKLTVSLSAPNACLNILKFDPRLETNLRLHETSNYEIATRSQNPQLVVRRGQVLYLYLFVDRQFSPAHDIVSLVFTFKDCEDASVGHYTLAVVPLTIGKSEGFIGKWAAWIHDYKGKRIDLRAISTSDCTIGKWGIEIDTMLTHKQERSTFTLDGDIYIIFNPYAPEDEVRIDEELAQEYVALDHGAIYRGNMKPDTLTHWVYGQFAKDVLDCALYLLTDVAKLPVSRRANPVEVARALTSTINAENSKTGIMLPCWTGSVEKSESPLLWCASAPILQSYYSNKQPLRYANCLVFAGILTTVCRTLGIPARPVTSFNYINGHDEGLVLNRIYSEFQPRHFEPYETKIWNYHVWTEVWMKRLDLGNAFDGWQILDATPQMPVSDVFAYGPTSVRGIRNGNYKAPYNGRFCYCGINSDVFFWKKIGDGHQETLKLVGIERSSVGIFISTKAAGLWARKDLTLEYKDPKAKKEESDDCYSALCNKETDFSRLCLSDTFNEVAFQLSCTESVSLGQEFSAKLDVVNRNNKDSYVVWVSTTISPVHYTGKVEAVIKNEIFDLVLAPSEAAFCRTTVSFEEYSHFVLSEFLFKCTCQATIKSVDFDYYSEIILKLEIPKISIEANTVAKVGKTMSCTAQFVNPLPITLTNGLLFLQGPFFNAIKAITVEDCAPNKRIVAFFSVTPLKQGEFLLLAKFMSDQLSEVEGHALIRAECEA